VIDSLITLAITALLIGALYLNYYTDNH